MIIEIINWLNVNQGVIGFLSLVVTIIGFFVVTKSIKVINRQSQKGGDSSLNQQAQNSGINQNAKRDITNN